MSILVNALAFQLGWLACVLGGANQLPWAGTLVAACIVAWHLSQVNCPGREFALLAAAGVLGAVWDSLLVAAGWLSYPSGTLLADTAPYWIVAMWVLFASTLNVSLRWLRGRWKLATLLGALGGPLAYYAGAGLGGVIVTAPWLAFGALAAGWAVFMPLLVALAMHLDGMRAGPVPAGV
ncbi:MAG: DUF2878 domain-containing protein [Thiogranum sp.]|jgi:hypothetical protein